MMNPEVPTASQILDGKVIIPIEPQKDWKTYVVDMASAQDHWLSYAFRGFEEIYRQTGKVDHFVAIGTGSGIDAIGAIEIMHPERVTVTDLAPAILERAKENIALYQQNGGKKIPVTFGLGSLCAPLNTDKADIIYTNLPNLPVPPEQKARLMEGGTSAVFFDPDSITDVPDAIEKHLLSLQHTFLLQTRYHLSDHGKVVMNLGARMPLDAIYSLFKSAGYEPHISFFGLKLQSSPLWSIPQYAMHEKDGVTFSYFPYEEGKKQLEGKDITSVEQFAEELEPLRISSSEALKRAETGEKMGYIATLIIAQKKPL